MTTFETTTRTDDQPLPGASFSESIRRFFARWRTYSGRASRAEYWNVALMQLLVSSGLYVLVLALEATDPSLPGLVAMGVVLLLWILVIVPPTLALNARRLHDVNMSGWWQLLSCVPSVGWLFMTVIALLPPNEDGSRFDRG